jgi:ubiquinone/menaquinone biosynthesis C-methylase UbiE
LKPLDYTEQLISDFWDENVANWKVAAELDTGSPEFFQEVERYRFEKLDYLPKVIDYSAFAGKKVLDLGCGLATDLSRFAKGGANVTGVDISPNAIRLAKDNFSQRDLSGEFMRMNGHALDFEDQQFDLVYCHTVLHFTNEPQKMVDEIHRVLKPGGSALVMTVNRASWLYVLHKLAGMKIDYLDSPVFSPFNYSEFESLFQSFASQRLVVERFPVRTEVHHGLKAFLYNTCFVDLYNALPNKLIGKTGYHLLAFVDKSA